MDGKCYRDLGFAKVDTGREKRRGFPEAVYCPGKTKQEIRDIAGVILKQGQSLLLTRIDKAVYVYLKRHYPFLKYSALARMAYVRRKGARPGRGLVLVISAGTADRGVAEEAALTAEILGSPVERLFDVGVAGVHRLMDKQALLSRAKVIVVVAGMEGALASLVSGLVDCPVIGVPASVGYGASFGGVSALLSMLNSCSPGVSVVNIDNGFGAGYLANLINP
ncbi:MAG: nickel pincer cofactor biosynthesis protein LarB [Candidatus Omnitrophota bacterium]